MTAQQCMCWPAVFLACLSVLLFIHPLTLSLCALLHPALMCHTSSCNSAPASYTSSDCPGVASSASCALPHPVLVLCPAMPCTCQLCLSLCSCALPSSTHVPCHTCPAINKGLYHTLSPPP
eukprot:TRINITY_DN12503_c0_g1_i1.p1 TRINITY_DN12503_c0_g1~~TRINITY_DN12503_c0_g1_i1.p1  ORF type:complete len:121 (+),score=19.48 TRINITY_DN12503_c0_g1_i1:530-892(+)